jgi:hypothetical protein
MIQLPDDIISTGYKKVGQFKFEQVFKSKKFNFEGTEQEFYKNRSKFQGKVYKYVQINDFKRLCIK